jgi:hypothetical protein
MKVFKWFEVRKTQENITFSELIFLKNTDHFFFEIPLIRGIAPIQT